MTRRFPNLTVGFETLGCKLNQYETDSIATEMKRRGCAVVTADQPADAYVVNSCTVTNKADRKSRQALYRALRRSGSRINGDGSADSVVVLTGCYVDSHVEALRDSRATYVVDNQHKNRIPDILEAHFRGEIVDPANMDGDVFGFSPPEQVFHTRTNVKIQDGCDNFCTFCIIPFVRGRANSRPPAEVLAEIYTAVDSGSREIVLTGVNMSRYRHGDLDFVDLVGEILQLDGDFRVRISSLEPDGLDERFAQLFKHPKMSPHLHLCVQSGSDRTLLRMRRMYTVQTYREVVARLRTLDPDFNITTDVIVGFPGETDEEFRETLDLVEELGIGHVHLFPYSVRTGTRAGRMPDQVSKKVQSVRGATLRSRAQEAKRVYRRRLVGRDQRVLLERVSREGQRYVGTGFGQHYVPVRLVSDTYLRANSFYEVKVDALSDDAEPDLICSLKAPAGRPGESGPGAPADRLPVGAAGQE